MKNIWRGKKSVRSLEVTARTCIRPCMDHKVIVGDCFLNDLTIWWCFSALRCLRPKTQLHLAVVYLFLVQLMPRGKLWIFTILKKNVHKPTPFLPCYPLPEVLSEIYDASNSCLMAIWINFLSHGVHQVDLIFPNRESNPLIVLNASSCESHKFGEFSVEGSAHLFPPAMARNHLKDGSHQRTPVGLKPSPSGKTAKRSKSCLWKPCKPGYACVHSCYMILIDIIWSACLVDYIIYSTVV